MGMELLPGELGGMFSVLKIIVWSYEPAFVVANQKRNT